MINQPEGLIRVLLDKTAREDEGDDAAMDLGSYPTKEVLEALYKVAIDKTENDTILDSCGESLGEIWVKKEKIEREKIVYLSDTAFRSARGYIKQHKPEWLVYFDKGTILPGELFPGFKTMTKREICPQYRLS